MLDCIIDVSHHNGPGLDFGAARAAGILAMIHKATQGSAGVDPMFASNSACAAAAGMLLGAYHFGDGSDGAAQAQHFVATIGPSGPRPRVLVLDLETDLTGPTMSPPQAVAFVNTVQQLTGRVPMIYTGRWFLGGHVNPVLAQCPLWLPEYGGSPIVPAGWENWSLWQWTDGCAGNPDPVPGIGHCDQSRFDGSEVAFRTFWSNTAPA